QRQIGDDERTSLNPRQRLELRDYRVGQFVYDHYRSQVGANPTQAQQAWLDQVRAQVVAVYPGYGSNSFQSPADIAQKVSHDYAIDRELGPMARDPALASNPIAGGIVTYMHYRAEALKALGADL